MPIAGTLACPTCHGRNLTTELRGILRGPDTNGAVCNDCGWEGIVEDAKVAVLPDGIRVSAPVPAPNPADQNPPLWAVRLAVGAFRAGFRRGANTIPPPPPEPVFVRAYPEGSPEVTL